MISVTGETVFRDQSRDESRDQRLDRSVGRRERPPEPREPAA